MAFTTVKASLTSSCYHARSFIGQAGARAVAMAVASPLPARLLWDQGGLWSLMALEAHEALGLPIAPMTAAEVAAGGLDDARLLVAPGGWPALKLRALGRKGAAAIKDFVNRGGLYLGFCGGAGLALDVADGLGLVNLGRARGSGRLPSLSGPFWVEPGPGAGDHPLWEGLTSPARFQVWWPGQFEHDPGARALVVAAYRGPAPGLCSADLAVDEVAEADWPAHEKAYGLRLDPRALAGRPAVVEAAVGRGLVLLSYLHLDTPGDPDGERALANLWRAWLGVEAAPAPPMPEERLAPLGEELVRRADGLWDLGGRLGLWRPRHPLMPFWRRGVRGLELWSLTRLTRALAGRASRSLKGGEVLARAAESLAPLWDQGPAVLAVLARRLRGEPVEGLAGARAEKTWFPAPRRVGGDLALALAALERGLLEVWRQGPSRRTGPRHD